jgi:translation initiation factor IF-2
MAMKIFELAKDLGKAPLELVEELKAKGHAVRNHMTSLTDEQVTQILAEYKAASEVGAEKKTKKKIVRKKAKKKATSTGKVAAAASNPTSTSTVTRKKTSVIRKKTTGEVIEAEEVSIEASAEDTPVETVTKKKVVSKKLTSEVFEETEAPKKEKTESGGLRVVSRPEVVKEPAPPVKPSVNATEEEKELYKEKVHKFTPVFIPEKKEPQDVPAGKEQVASGEETAESSDDPSKTATDSKKRLGGLASMMSGKKVNINKSQALVQERADSELKSYAALSGIGRPIYTQVKRKRAYSGPTKGTELTELKESKRIVKAHSVVTGVELAKKMKVKLKELVDKCLDLNLLLKGEDYIGLELAQEIAHLYGYRVDNVAFDEDAVIGKVDITEEEKQKLPLRDPIITIMGHVDHGKTTLLDHIRDAKVAAGEAGGITQHIGAYSVVSKSGKKLTFLDTPGHAAFAAMRQRGANVTDIVVLVVAADDGVMPQTKESIKFIQNAGVPMIVAVNKMDKEGANPDRVKTELSEFHITPEDWGGDTMMIPISALNGDGVDDLLESIALQAEIMDLREDPAGTCEGTVIESKVEPGRGPVATILIEKGTLKKGTSIVVGECIGRARSLTDHLGKELANAGPSTPVQILGLNEAPNPGDVLNVVKNEREGKKIIQNRIDERKQLLAKPKKAAVSLEDFFATAAGTETEKKTLNLIVRADVLGSYEAIRSSLETLTNPEVEVKVLGGGVGPITDSDVSLAIASSAIIIGFNMRPVTSARRMAEERGIEVRTYSIIYELINEVKLALEGMLEPEFIERYIGRAEVKETFNVPKIGLIAGSVVVDGVIKIGCKVRLLREGKIVYDGSMSSLKRFKDDVKEVKSGYECGVGLRDFNDVKVGDLYECYEIEEKKRTLEDVAKAAEPKKKVVEEVETHL